MKDNFECEECGNCCKGRGYVYLTPEDQARLQEKLNMNSIDFREQFTVVYDRQTVLKSKRDNQCIFLDKNHCKVYDARPIQCRRWPFWKEIIEKKEFEESQKYCKGLENLSHSQFVELSKKNKNFLEKDI